MKIPCPLCGKILPRFESVLIHIKRVHPNVSAEKALELAYHANPIDLKFKRRIKKKRNSSDRFKKERNILLGVSPNYKKERPHSIHWKSVIKTPCK